ncbi:hypothetical protein AWR36_010185 [Microbulbifer flavimaris]|uniref:Uncharacterized protein n=1 Tax=Microbulbifer flavimaris TaxID=1781068 RepID=A0ABX4HYX2_9GAMM|nr:MULTISPECIES: hypothetical protein [Microbulbifer]KUJ82909.1 hypothetical protein AVO43_10155 [Microbulbifer sp. ZGT114]PCO05091.1 hypothetical protein AWR36_010185 [Microbulbifer flavimaris]
MQVIKTIRPGQKGARRFERRFGKRLCAVRYRNSPCGSKVLTTVELIVDERDKPAPGVSHSALQAYQRAEPVALSVGAEENAMQRLLKQAGARWSQKARAWVATRETAATLGLNHRIVEGLIDACIDVDTSIEL